jgi:hypothetical protein
MIIVVEGPSGAGKGLPSDGITPKLIAKGNRARRSGLDLFEQLMSELAAV